MFKYKLIKRGIRHQKHLLNAVSTLTLTGCIDELFGPPFGTDANDGKVETSNVDHIQAVSGDNYRVASNQRDFIDGGEGEDTIDGGQGDDQLIGMEGNDTLQRGDGQDTAFISSNATRNQIIGDKLIITTQNGDTYYLTEIEFIQVFGSIKITDIKSIFDEINLADSDEITNEADYLQWLTNDAAYDYESV